MPTVGTAERYDFLNIPNGWDGTNILMDRKKIIPQQGGSKNEFLVPYYEGDSGGDSDVYAFYDVLIRCGIITSYAEGDSYFNRVTGYWNGHMFLGGKDITDTELDTFIVLKSVGGILNLSHNPFLTNVDGLSNLTNVEGSFSLEYNNITNVDGLSNLTSVGSRLSLSNNPSLTNVDGLSNLTSVNGLGLENVPNITNAHLAPLSGLTIQAALNLEGTTPADCSQTHITTYGYCLN